eukprot:482034-Amphidinium_carterae.1
MSATISAPSGGSRIVEESCCDLTRSSCKLHGTCKWLSPGPGGGGCRPPLRVILHDHSWLRTDH